MPKFIVERQFAEQFDPDVVGAELFDPYEDEHDIKWLMSFLSADKKKTYCLYECADLEVLRRHAVDLGLPVDAITEVGEMQR